MLRCVAFLGYRDIREEISYGGTGLLLVVDYHEDGSAPLALRYLVTARHVVSGVPSVPGSGLRHQREQFAEFTDLNHKTFHVSLVDSEWIFPEDGTIDLAICYFPSRTPRSLAYNENLLFTSEELAARGIGIGDETYSVSLLGFNRKPLSKTPIARIGNIAMLPLEKAGTEFGEADVYLIESRSLSGFSGAPVFVRQTVRLPEQHDEQGRPFQPDALGYVYLLGIMHGHKELDSDNARGINTGLAYVVPAEKLKELILSNSFRLKMRAHIAQEREHGRNTQRSVHGE